MSKTGGWSAKPSIEKIGTAWHVNWTERHHGQVIFKGKRFRTHAEALAFAGSLA